MGVNGMLEEVGASISDTGGGKDCVDCEAKLGSTREGRDAGEGRKSVYHNVIIQL